MNAVYAYVSLSAAMLLDWENKSLTSAEDMECKSSCCEVEVLMNFLFREINFVVREMSCTACKILLGNPEKLDDLY